MNFRKTLALTLLAPAFLAGGALAMNTPRHNHAVTLLPDGNILVTGGRTGTNTATDAVEMYNMSANAWQDWTGGLVTERSSHTATLMSDGRVLIAGGFGTAGTPLNSLEICDTRSFTCAAPAFGHTTMLTARGGHTATLLTAGANAGRVLLCGGQTSVSAATSNCEIFDPVAQTRAAAPSMPSARTGQVATLMHSGRVFISGGRQRNLADTAWIYAAQNEIYDPASGAWMPAASLLQGRTDHTATVLNNGIIMITGGYNASNRLRCMVDSDSLEEDCWHIANPATAIAQGAGNHGYLDGAEFFDQNGAAVTLMETNFNLMPYRVSRHSALLEADGRWRIHRGYGNIYPTFFNDSPNLANTGTIVRFDTVAGSSTTATVRTDSTINMPLEFNLVRPVSGRLVDADAFLSGPSPGSASISVGGANITIPVSTAVADGAAVGRLLGDNYDPGAFNSIVALNSPTGTAAFDPVTVSLEDATVLSSDFTGPEIYPGQQENITATSLWVYVSFKLSDVYRSRIYGAATIETAKIESTSHSITLNGGAAPFNIGASSCDSVKDECTFASWLEFSSVAGSLLNLTPGTTYFATNPPGPFQSPPGFQAPLNVGITSTSATLRVEYTANEVYLLDKNSTYNMTQSTMVIRGMIFSNHLTYTPKDNKWSDLADTKIAGLHSLPSFDHTATYTPAGDTFILGGRNCEAAPIITNCTNRIFDHNIVNFALIPAIEGNWPAGPLLNSRRAFHTSTLLPDGKILTCGGTDGANPLSSCEALDPSTNKWETTGGMNSPRANHTATLLPNGNVLVAGGTTPGGQSVSSAEIYYPETRTWVNTGAMANPRQLHTATVMPDGNVLVTGGSSTNQYSATAEVYITSAAHWVSGGNLLTGRQQHTATLLKNGLVLVAGGINSFGAIASAELYNYQNRTSAATAPMANARYDHTATLLRDGRVLIAGGSVNSLESSRSCEIFSGAGWAATASLNYNRARHRAVLLPNGKVMLTGGEISGVVQNRPEGFDPDLSAWSEQGTAASRSRHTSVLTRDNKVINIGGWNGGQYLDTTEYADFNFSPDSKGLLAGTTRQPHISDGTKMFDNNWRATLISDTSNFHGITEAAGGGAGAMTSSHSNPRVYMQQIDNPSGFMIDLSTRIYSHYGGPNTNWSRTLSSITVIAPSLSNEMPRGWYQMRVAANGVFSEGFTVQVSTPRPTGAPSVPSAAVQGVSSITWNWNRGTIPADGGDGFAVYSATNNVFITTISFANSGDVSYTQTGIAPNTPVSIMVAAYNQGGYGELTKSATYHTLAAIPANLTITDVSFETVTLSWKNNGNTPITRYELSMARESSDFSVNISTPVGFDDDFTSTTYTVTAIEPNALYYFRVRARNGDGVVTVSTPSAPPYVSTVTVAQVQNLQGTPLSGHQISWSWMQSGGADYYKLYDITSGTESASLIASTPDNYFTQAALSTNTVYQVMAFAVKNTGSGPVRGSPGYSPRVYTLANPPAPWPFSGVTTSTITFNWLPNGNPPETSYTVQYSSYSDYAVFASTRVSGMTAYTAPRLSPNTAYYARVYAVNGSGVPTASADLGSKYTHAQPPTSVTATGIAMSGITINWSKGSNPDPTYYELRGSTNNFVTVSTYVAFSQLFSGDTATVSGLLTSTTYQFDVAAINGEGLITARTRVAPDVLTLPGPSGTPSGAVGGTGVPGTDSLISGVLPNGHAVSMLIPSGAFQSETAVAIASHSVGVVPYSSNPCRVSEIPVLAVDIFSQGGQQPFEPVSFTIGYGNMTSAQISQINTNLSKLVWARYNPVNDTCLPLETAVRTGPRTITSSLNHFSVFQLIVKQPASSLSGVLIYPNPFFPNRGQGFVTFNNLPSSAKVRVYTLSGSKVWEGTATSSGVLTWRGVNESGNPVGSGVYFVSVRSTVGDKIFKLAVER